MPERENGLQEYVDDSVSSVEILRFLRAQFWVISATLIAGAIAGFGVSHLKPRQWEATSVLQIGQIADSAQGTAELIDPPARAAERVKVRSFQDKVLRTLSLPIGSAENSSAVLIRKTLDAEVVPNTDLVHLSVDGFSPEQARATLEVAQNQLLAIHQPIVSDAINRLQAQLGKLDAQIANLQAKRRYLPSAADVKAQSGAGSQGAADVLLSNILDTSNEGVLVEAERRRAEVATQLSPDHTFATKPLGDITVSEFPVAPKRSSFIIPGALIGLLIGLLIGGLRWVRR
ncbi:hypothetical protein [Trinickia sp.]|uniref:hypothetical protein n=1 Tax=Trinickia sp. TaxID=2571163 RepID=UPI003F7FA556